MFDTLIVGAGIIGLTTACRLTEAGQKVLILDRKGMALETSGGIAGAFAFAYVEPLASPGILWKAPTDCLTRSGPCRCHYPMPRGCCAGSGTSDAPAALPVTVRRLRRKRG